MTLFARLTKGRELERQADPLSFAEWQNYFSFNGLQYGVLGTGGTPAGDGEKIEANFRGYVDGAMKANGVVFACMVARLLLFSEARFRFRREVKGRPGDLFGTTALRPLEVPWERGTTGDLLARMMTDVDLAGNFYGVRRGQAIRRLRPDWVTIVTGSRSGSPIDTETVGYLYQDGGPASGNDPEVLLPDQVCHWAPIPDPIARVRGMSWLQPIVEEIMADKAATSHKRRFFDGGAQLGYVVTLDPDGRMNPEQFKQWVATFRAGHESIENAYKCLHPDTEVALWNGARCPASDVRTGDLVVAWADGRPVPGMVKACEPQPPSPIVTITTTRGRVIKTNDRHPFLTSDGWVEAQHLSPGDKLTIGLGWGRPRLQDSLTPMDAWMVGMMVGDGSLVGSPSITIANAAIRDRMAGIVKLVKLPERPRAMYDYRVNGIGELMRGLGLNGSRSYEKRIPAAIMTGGHEVVCAFLSGLIDSDGHVSDPDARHSCDTGITSTSRELLRDAQHLLASLGISASISSPPSMAIGAVGGSSGVIRRHDGHRLIVSGNRQAAMLAGLLDLAHDEKARRLALFAERSSSQDRSRWDRVRTVEVSAPEVTIGIEIADHHTHVTGGVVTHNTLFLSAGADIKVVGADLKSIDFAAVQGHGETRICAAARVPAIIAGVSEGLDSATYSNYAQARRAFGDLTMRPLWRTAAASLAPLVAVPAAAELWYDARDIPFLQEDVKDEAEIQQTQAATIASLVREGFTAESSILAVMNGDMNLLDHTGLVSVQLLPNTAPADQPPEPQLPAPSNGAVPAAAGANGRRLLEQFVSN